MNLSRLASVALATVLQLVPLSRVAVSEQALLTSGFSVVFRWLAGTSMALGGFQAVSGASTVITSPLTATATNGVAFTYRITTGPHSANQFSAAPLPSGLAVGFTTGRITGTPTAVGVWKVNLTASDNGSPSRTTTAILTLTVISPTPAIATQPKNVTVKSGSTATFSVVATGTGPLRYQWQKDGEPVPSATNATLSLPAVTSALAGAYRVVVTNTLGTATSTPATLTVLEPPIITSQPAAQTVAIGDPVSLTAVVSGTAPLGYQWFFNLSPIAGATGPTYAIANASPGDVGDYFLHITNSVGSTNTATAHLTVVQPVPLTLSASAAAQTQGSFRFVVTGPVNADYIIWSSQDLVSWLPLGTNHVVDGQWVFTDTVPSPSAGFYRATRGQ
jgi:hypothetical protein